MSVASEVPCVEFANFQDGESVVPNGNVLFSPESSQNMPVKGDRIIKKAKRLTKLSPRKDENGTDRLSPDSPGVNNNSKVPLQYTKNSRKSRGLHGRGLPKKGKIVIYTSSTCVVLFLQWLNYVRNDYVNPTKGHAYTTGYDTFKELSPRQVCKQRGTRTAC